LRPTRLASVIIALNAFLLLFLTVTLYGLVSLSFPVQFTDVNGNKFLGHGISDFALNGISGLLLFVLIIAFVELLLLARLWRELRKAQGQPPPVLEAVAKSLARRVPRSLRISTFGVLVASLFLPPIIYGMMVFGVFTNNTSYVSSVLSVSELAALFFLVVDGVWPSLPDSRFGSFQLNRNRHKVWLGINTVFYYIVFLEVFEIVFIIELASIAYIHQPTQNGDPFAIAALLSFLYLFYLVIRNSICNLMGQGYGRFSPFPGKIGGTSIVGVAAVADLARTSFTRTEWKGKEYLQSSTRILSETLSVRRIKMDGLDELAGALSFMGAFGTKIPYEKLSVLASEFAKLSSPLESVQSLTVLSSKITSFLKDTDWPSEFHVIPLKRWTENAALIATVGGALVTAVGVAFEILHVSVPSTGTTISLGLLGDLLAIIETGVMVWLSYGPFSRLEGATVGLADLRKL